MSDKDPYPCYSNQDSCNYDGSWNDPHCIGCSVPTKPVEKCCGTPALCDLNEQCVNMLVAQQEKA